jgi:bacillopeptidase F
MPLRLLAVALISLLLTAAPPARAGSLSPDLAAALESLPAGEELAVIAFLGGAPRIPSLGTRGSATDRTRAIADFTQAGRASLGSIESIIASFGGTRVKRLILAHALAFRGNEAAILAVTGLSEVRQVALDAVIRLPEEPAPLRAQPMAPAGQAEPGWNLALVGASKMWSRRITGSGVVLAVVDTGVDAQHPDLAPAYRGGGNSWYDPYGQHPTPYDGSTSGHGTGVAGLASARYTGGERVGMAPGASWIAVKIFDDTGAANLSDIALGYDWLLDPDRDQATDDAPGIVNNSWDFTTADDIGACRDVFASTITTFKALGIMMVFAGGNAGPGPGTSLSPANNPGALAVGHVGADTVISSQSSRGPSACDGRLYPDLVAPGEQTPALNVPGVRTTDKSFGGYAFYADRTGSSFAAPHVAGAAALLRSALPSASLDQVEAALLTSAVDLGEAGPDNVYGQGLLDVGKAYDLLLDATGACRGDINLDGRADLKDLRLLRTDWGRADCATLGCAGDLDFDDAVDQADLDIFTADLHRTCPER